MYILYMYIFYMHELSTLLIEKGSHRRYAKPTALVAV